MPFTGERVWVCETSGDHVVVTVKEDFIGANILTSFELRPVPGSSESIEEILHKLVEGKKLVFELDPSHSLPDNGMYVYHSFQLT